MQVGNRLRPVELNYRGYQVRVHPPCQGMLTQPIHPLLPEYYAMDESFLGLRPAVPVPIEGFTIDDAAVFPANLLVLDFIATTFDRQAKTPEENGVTKSDPPISLVFDLANDVIGRLRTITRGSDLRPIDEDSVSWTLDYLDNEGREVEVEDGLIRGVCGNHFSLKVLRVSDNIWKKAWELPEDHIAYPWDRLLLDAQALMPDIGAVIAVVNAALETFAQWMNDELSVRSTLDPDLFDWLNDLAEKMKGPSVPDRYDVLLKVFTGKSLKDEQPLWGALMKIRGARNNFMHRGKVAQTKKTEELTIDEVSVLMEKANEIVNWVEALLPAELHRPKLNENYKMEVVVKKAQPETPTKG